MSILSDLLSSCRGLKGGMRRGRDEAKTRKQPERMDRYVRIARAFRDNPTPLNFATRRCSKVFARRSDEKINREKTECTREYMSILSDLFSKYELSAGSLGTSSRRGSWEVLS